MEKLNCVYIERQSGEKNTIEVELQKIEQLNMGIIRQTIRKNNRIPDRTGNIGKRRMDKQDKRILRIIKKLCNKKTVMMANEQLVADFSLPNIYFEMKKAELLKNIKEIMQYLWGGIEGKGRKTCLLVMDSDKWCENDIREILVETKNHYENIYISNENNTLDTDALADFFYDECGVVLHPADGEKIGKMEMDTVLFLIKEWKDKYSKIDCRNGYVVSETEKGLVRKRKRMQETGIQNGGRKKEIYMGFVYAYCGKQILYELALLLENHTGLQYLRGQQCAVGKIYIVAIYAMEWYNNTCL